ncbi:chemotaxis-specific protein-glutamate methyltransferase CheB [Paenibacillus pasadenensis]|uniref:chemotaxis-specific protein-glutamate methyltransferase CheB n=1 Tax=Paenibacillus pasadenensis TaxID=217090 RepID=UPI002040577C|nr:chemotaxis-specific protein-glutamate methyltransferase CheB [Paenibacillus pasadenensis]MCM3745991.1 chemotaxis-specific protein-glutamate methyltransferase CheB [Paenibacillus pasadenensis]
MPQFRVLIVDDSAFMRAVIKDLIEADPAFEIAGMASTGKEAIEAVLRLKPDVMTLDLEMPEMNGLEALGPIMAAYPLPVIMFSGISEEHTSQTIAALQQGAFDFIRKPAASSPPGEIGTIGRLLREKLHTAVLIRERLQRQHSALRQPPGGADALLPKSALSKAKPDAGPAPGSARTAGKAGSKAAQPDNAAAHASKITEEADPRKKPAAGGAKVSADQTGSRPERLAQAGKEAAGAAEQARRETAAARQPGRKDGLERHDAAFAQTPAVKPAAGTTAFNHLIAVGTSTGGPRALHELLAGIPAELQEPVLMVQHMPPRFTASLAKRLDAAGPLRVFEAADGQRVRSGEAYLAPGGRHMELARDELGYFIRLTQNDPVSGHRPSVDVLFRSLVPFTELKRHAVILTGMGSDGSRGMLELKESGAASTIAEAEDSCVVYGMPRSAVENGSCQTVLPLPLIAGELYSRCSGGSAR